MTFYERFLSLPRGRRGDKTVVIVDEAVLAKLFYDATWKHPEVSETFRQSMGPAPKPGDGPTTNTGGPAGGTPMQINITSGPPAPPTAVLIEEARRVGRLRGPGSSVW